MTHGLNSTHMDCQQERRVRYAILATHCGQLGSLTHFIYLCSEKLNKEQKQLWSTRHQVNDVLVSNVLKASIQSKICRVLNLVDLIIEKMNPLNLKKVVLQCDRSKYLEAIIEQTVGLIWIHKYDQCQVSKVERNQWIVRQLLSTTSIKTAFL